MYEIRKELEIAGAHNLCLNYKSKCNNVHGHNWIVTVICRAEELNENGMVVDFSEISKVVMALDHKDLNDFISQPTAENIAKWICDRVENCVRVEIYESKGNLAIYEEGPATDM